MAHEDPHRQHAGGHATKRSRTPSTEELLERLERDVAWLRRRHLWTRRLFERAMRRYVHANGSPAGLDAFALRHDAEEWLVSDGAPTNVHPTRNDVYANRR